MAYAAVVTALLLIGGLLFLLGRNAERRANEQRSRRGASPGGVGAAGDGYSSYGGSEGVSGDHCGFGGDSGTGGGDGGCH
jgi:hypothetical protein